MFTSKNWNFGVWQPLLAPYDKKNALVYWWVWKTFGKPPTLCAPRSRHSVFNLMLSPSRESNQSGCIYTHLLEALCRHPGIKTSSLIYMSQTCIVEPTASTVELHGKIRPFSKKNGMIRRVWPVPNQPSEQSMTWPQTWPAAPGSCSLSVRWSCSLTSWSPWTSRLKATRWCQWISSHPVINHE